MDFIGLISGGKDSIYSICKCIEEGNNLKALLYVKSTVDTIDSYMFQTVGSEIIKEYEKCLNVPLHVIETKCNTINKNLEYEETYGDEVEDLFYGLKKILAELDFKFISSGAIHSNYQKNRLENICKRLNIKVVSPLFGMCQKQLLNDILNYRINAIVVKVAGGGLNKTTIGKNLGIVKEIYDKSKFKDVNYCGEGGEFETMVLDCPLFLYRILIQKFEVFNHPDEPKDLFEDRTDGVFFMKILKWKLEKK